MARRMAATANLNAIEVDTSWYLHHRVVLLLNLLL